MKKFIRSSVILLLILSITGVTIADTEINTDDILVRPFGEYLVGFKDFSLKDQKINVRIYYPIEKSIQSPYAPYHLSAIGLLQTELTKVGITEKINQLDDIKSFTVGNAPIVSEKKFPVLIFSPGAGLPIQFYENFITELASQGYIVIGINSSIDIPALSKQMFGKDTNSLSEKEGYELYEKLKELLIPDIKYVYDVIHNPKLYTLNDSIFSAMDLERIGGFGHSIGSDVIIKIAYDSSNGFKIDELKFQAVASIDVSDLPNSKSREELKVPFMYIVAADVYERVKDKDQKPSSFKLGEKGFLVTISRDKEDKSYSKHMNFCDLSTLKKLSAIDEYAKKYDLLGTGDGREITASINKYLVKFFDIFLKHGDDKGRPGFSSCIKLENTCMECGAGHVKEEL